MPFSVLLVAFLVFRALGYLGVCRFASWRVSAAHALAVLLLVTAIAHFLPPSVTVMPNRVDMVAMVPPLVPYPEAAVFGTGVLELLAAAGLVLPRTRRWAGLGIAVLFVLMFPANVYSALDSGQVDATPLWIRAPEQVVYIGVALWSAGLADIRAARGTPPSGRSLNSATDRDNTETPTPPAERSGQPSRKNT